MVIIWRIKRIQMRLAESYMELEEKVEERTQELAALNAQLKHYSETDELTQVNNRRMFNRFIKYQIDSSRRSHTDLSLILIDIDYFKHYNDNYGHQQGDECLVQVANLLGNSLVRATDFIARYGGEEFVAVLPTTDIEGAKVVSERIKYNLASAAIKHEYSEADEHVTVSQGITSYQFESRESCDEFLERADRCLYQAKSEGRNRYVAG